MVTSTHDNILESKRVKQFRLAIAKQIPKFPNDRHTLSVLEAKPLSSLLLAYTNWAYRLVPPRRRKVTIEPTLTADSRWKALRDDAKTLLDRASRGDDLNPYLSLRVRHNGFTPAASDAVPTTDKWEDKDFFLVTMGYHHFHLSQVIEAAGHAKRTDVVLFAQVTKKEFNAIGFFDHSVFEQTGPASQSMTAERERLWNLYEQRSSLGRRPGGVYMDNPIATSGHSLAHTRLAFEFTRVIQSVDPMLDDLASRAALFNTLPHETVKAMKLRWHLNYLDLGLLDKPAAVFYTFRYGPT